MLLTVLLFFFLNSYINQRPRKIWAKSVHILSTSSMYEYIWQIILTQFIAKVEKSCCKKSGENEEKTLIIRTLRVEFPSTQVHFKDKVGFSFKKYIECKCELI